MRPGVPGSSGFGGISEQLRIRQAGLAPGLPVPGYAKIRQDTFGERDIECLVSGHMPDVTLSAWLCQPAYRSGNGNYSFRERESNREEASLPEETAAGNWAARARMRSARRKTGRSTIALFTAMAPLSPASTTPRAQAISARVGVKASAIIGT